MGSDQNRPRAGDHLANAARGALLKIGIADREYLINEENFWI